VRRPSPALVIACVALFVALGGAGFAASRFVVQAVRPTMFFHGRVGANGSVVVGPGLKASRVSAGVYTLTITGDPFRAGRISPGDITVVAYVVDNSAGAKAFAPPVCNPASSQIQTDGSATAKVECFTLDPAAGWQPTDAAFSFAFSGPPH
jgi:hypothetical protein